MHDAAERLVAMAERIRHNAEEEFAGCLVVLPPEGVNGQGGEAIELLLIDPKRDAVNFWSTVRAKVEIGERTFQAQIEQGHLGFR
jgi:hypothetical protein